VTYRKPRPPRIKICGITNLEDALFCSQMGAHALGFIFYGKSPRYIDPSKAAMIIHHLPPRVTPVGVFVNESRENILAIVRQAGIRTVQLSGDEEAPQCEGFGVDVWKAFRIRERSLAAKTRDYQIAAALLEGAGDTEYGGSGKVPDFDTAIELKKYHPVILAGGINPENILDAFDAVLPHGIDVNSGVEMVPGKKDHQKVRMLFDALGRHDKELDRKRQHILSRTKTSDPQ
jgi:phosphoribosylanthranilate isomerase